MNKIGGNCDFIEKLKLFLQISSVASARYLAAVCLKNIFASNWNKIETKIKLDFKDYLISFLIKNGAQDNLNSIKAILQCFAQTVKFGWFEDPKFKDSVIELQAFSSYSPSHLLISFIGYDLLINEMAYIHKGKYSIDWILI